MATGSVPEAGVRDPPAGILQAASVQRRVGLDEVVDGWLTKSLCLRQGMLAVVCSRQEPRSVAVSCDSSKETSDTRSMDSAATHSCAPARMLVLEFESTSRGKAAISDTCWIIFTRFPQWESHCKFTFQNRSASPIPVNSPAHHTSSTVKSPAKNRNRRPQLRRAGHELVPVWTAQARDRPLPACSSLDSSNQP